LFFILILRLKDFQMRMDIGYLHPPQNSLTPRPSPTRAIGSIGSLRLDGSGHLQVPHHPRLNPAAAISIERNTLERRRAHHFDIW
jgi:hypothetical protein